MEEWGHRALGRAAGIAYLVIVVTGIFSLAWAPGQLFDLDDPLATLTLLTEGETLLRWSIALELVCYATFLLLGLFLYRLLAPHGPLLAGAMILFVAASVPISMVAMIGKLAILEAVTGTGVAEVADPAAAVMVGVDFYRQGIAAAEVFWAAWLLPFGILAWRTRIIPRVLGGLLVAGSLAYLVNVFGPVLVPNWREVGLGEFLSPVTSLAEILAALWLALMGAAEPRFRSVREAA